jgi:hypothetical protein
MGGQRGLRERSPKPQISRFLGCVGTEMARGAALRLQACLAGRQVVPSLAHESKHPAQQQ